MHRVRRPDPGHRFRRRHHPDSPALNHALIKNYSIIGLHWGLYKQYNQQAIADCHEELTRLADSGAITPLISERLSLADVADGIGRLGDGSTVGRLVFQP